MLKRIAGGAVLTAVVSAGGAQAAQAEVLRMPFQCGTTMSGKVYSGHSPANAIDFNGLGGGDTDLGTPVVAAGSGVVKLSTSYTTNGYGNAIEVDHGGGRSTFYAHLQDRLVAVGATVGQGQLIAHLGDTSAKYQDEDWWSAHLHYEQRQNGSVVRASFGGALAEPYKHFGEGRTMKSGNCGRPAPPALTPPAGGGAGVELPATSFRFPAQVQTDNGRKVSGRMKAHTSARVVTRLAPGQNVRIVCQTSGQRVSGKFGTSRIWDLIDLGNGRGAFVTDTYVSTGKDGRVAPAC